MANIHVLGHDGHNVTVVCHISVPPGVNTANTPWAIAIVRSGANTPTRLPSGDGDGGSISPSEENSITTGNILERVETFVAGASWPTMSPAERIAMLDAWYADMRDHALADLREQLRFYGYTR